ncbi:radical SAM protein [Desulfovibrio desulfuricans]|uniref:radical SAM protein n=1 Tax=Desulfovibrio desulfuricans TaxID=876 RepID=UPI0003FB58B5|nr:radical SAM protein [Desulfovibrio desulfuricans]
MKELIIELTNRCLNNCIHCSSKSCGAGGKIHDISLHEIEPVVSSAINSGFHQVVFSGGEPLLHPEFDLFVKYFHSRNIPMKVYTSGVTDSSFFNDKEKIHAMSCLNAITVSCYASDRDLHNSITRNSQSYDKLQEFISQFHNTVEYFEMNFVPMALNAHEMNVVYEKYKEILSQFNVLKLVCQGNAKNNWGKLFASRECIDQELRILCGKQKTKIGNSFGELSNATYRCEAGSKKMCISFDGYVIPCEVFKSSRKEFRHCSEYALDKKLFACDAVSYSLHDYARGCQSGAILHAN